MPTYEYKCANCEKTIEIFQSITAAPVKKCPECGKNKLKRLLGTGAGLIFKGSGFYATDYRSESYNKSSQSEKPAASSEKTETKAETKTEIKTEVKAETKKDPKPAKPEKKTA